MGLVFHFNFKREASPTESRELNHGQGVLPAGKAGSPGPGLPSADGDVGRDAI